MKKHGRRIKAEGSCFVNFFVNTLKNVHQDHCQNSLNINVSFQRYIKPRLLPIGTILIHYRKKKEVIKYIFLCGLYDIFLS